MCQHTDSLERELAELTAHLEVATHRQLTILRELEPTRLWPDHGAASFAHWLSRRVGLAPGAAREKLRVARALGALPLIDRAFSAARLSYSKVRALSRVATPENESTLLDMALRMTAAHLERICRGLRRQAIERARAEGSTPHADAFVHVARSFDSEAQKSRPSAEVVVHVREEVLADGPGAMAAVLDDGRRVLAETLRRVACDCTTQAVAIDGSGLPIDVGRRRRTVTPALRRALATRDGCCRFPGCAHRAWLDAHHVEHWLHGGETSTKNLVLLCPFHHRLVHEGGFSIVQRAGARAFLDPRGETVSPVVKAPRLPEDAVSALRLRHVSAGTRVDEETLIPAWWGEPPDVDMCVAALRSTGGSAARRDRPEAA